MAAVSISSPVPVAWYPTLSVVMVAVGLMLTSSFFIYEATSSRRSRSFFKEITTAAVASVFLVSFVFFANNLVHLTSYEATSSRRSRSFFKEITTAAVASVFLGFGSLFVLLASGVYV